MAEILKAQLYDLDEIYQIETEAFGGDAYSKKMLKNQIQSPHNYFIVLKEPDDRTQSMVIVGYITIQFRKNHKVLRLYNFAVRKECRGFGYAERLYNTVMFPLQEFYYTKINLEVKVTNTPAIKFYERHGFKIDREIPFYYHDGQSAYKMSKVL